MEVLKTPASYLTAEREGRTMLILMLSTLCVLRCFKS